MAVPTIDKDTLMRAVLAMDVYHRGYNWGVSRDPNRSGSEPTSELPSQVGNWSVLGTPEQEPSIGFVAQAYTNGGQTILSFRGTDDGFAIQPNPFGSLGSDIVNGFGIGAGSPVGPQALAAINEHAVRSRALA